MKRLLRNEIPDKYLQKNFQILQEELDGQAILRCKWVFVSFSFDAAVTNRKIPHGLSFTPQDVIVMRHTGAGSITWNYGIFDKENLDVTTTGAVAIRALVGTYSEDPRT